MKSKLSISDQRMLALLEWALSHGVATTEKEYCEKIGFARTNMSNLRRGHQSFGRDHIARACKLTGANANWIFGFEDNMMRKKTKDPVEALKQAVIGMEQAYKACHSKRN